MRVIALIDDMPSTRPKAPRRTALRTRIRPNTANSKWIGTGGTSPFGAYGYNPEGTRIGQESSRNRAAVKVWDQREYRNLDDSVNSGTRNIKVALRRLRKFARDGAPKERVMMPKVEGNHGVPGRNQS